MRPVRRGLPKEGSKILKGDHSENSRHQTDAGGLGKASQQKNWVALQSLGKQLSYRIILGKEPEDGYVVMASSLPG